MLGLPLTPSAVVGAERIMLIFACAVRLGTLVEMTPAAFAAWTSPSYGVGTAVTWVVATAMVLAFVVVAATRRRLPTAQLILLDTGVAAVLLVAGAWTVPADVRIGSWIGFEPGYALSVVISAAACPNARAWVAGLAMVLVGKVVYVWSVARLSEATTLVGDFLTVVVMGGIAVLMAAYIRGLAAEADLARELAAREEQRRARTVFHNGVAVLGLLAQPDLDPGTLTAAQTQARAEVYRGRMYLSGDSAPPPAGPSSTLLTEVIRGAALGFPDLAPQLMLDLARDAQVADEHAGPLGAALVSLLLNVRLHAKASTTVIHADAEDGRWTVTVHDDGVGFDATASGLGVGLRDVVVNALAGHEIGTEIDSAPGFGTTITLTGRCAR